MSQCYPSIFSPSAWSLVSRVSCDALSVSGRLHAQRRLEKDRISTSIPKPEHADIMINNITMIMLQRIAISLYVLSCAFAATVPRIPTSRLATGSSLLQNLNHTFANSPRLGALKNATNFGVV